MRWKLEEHGGKNVIILSHSNVRFVLGSAHKESDFESESLQSRTMRRCMEADGATTLADLNDPPLLIQFATLNQIQTSLFFRT